MSNPYDVMLLSRASRWGSYQIQRKEPPMRFLKTIASVFGLFVFMLFALATPSQAQRPAYLHAISNLRQARSLLQTEARPGFADARDRASGEIDRAIHEIRAAIRDEGRESRWTPPPATQGDPDRPMRSALSLLDAARDDMSRGHDDRDYRGLQDRAIRHIDEARHILDRALHHMMDRGRDRDRRY